MADVAIFFLIQNIFVFCAIFWGLSVAGEYFYKRKDHTAKREFYECGFKSNTDGDLQINMQFSMLVVFLILYDVEFTMLFPFLFNVPYATFFSYLVFMIFMSMIIASLVYDWQMNALSWQFE